MLNILQSTDNYNTEQLLLHKNSAVKNLSENVIANISVNDTDNNSSISDYHQPKCTKFEVF